MKRTRKFLEEIDLYEMHVFKYSIRKGTKAADMKPQINDQIKAKRSNVLLEMSKQHQKEFETKQLGMVQRSTDTKKRCMEKIIIIQGIQRSI